MNFTDLGLIAPILRALKEKNYSQPTEIQHKAIPLVLDRKDVLGCAQTGTGKTAAFSIPMIQLIHRIEGKNKRPTLRGLILSPTRELAIQIDEQIRAYSKHTIVKHTVIYGGVKQGKQVDKLRRGVHILVATPGRLLDLIGQGLLDISTVKMFVLDEADRMLDMGFIHDINKVIKMLPKKRQSLFFSATMPDSIVKLSQKILRDPVEVAAARVSSAADTVQQLIYYTNRATKKNLLLHVLKDPAMDQVLLFSRTKARRRSDCQRPEEEKYHRSGHSWRQKPKPSAKGVAAIQKGKDPGIGSNGYCGSRYRCAAIAVCDQL